MKLLVTFLLSLLIGLNAFAETKMFKIVPGGSRNEIQFRSDAATETVVGRTRMASGFVDLDPASDQSPARAEIHVDLASIKTGIDLRDRHMRENHLETSQYPEAVFTLTSLSIPVGSLPDGQRTPVRIRGKLNLHGVERDIEPETYLTYSRGGVSPTLRIESNFVVNLSDYNIKRPQFLVLRLAEDQKISIDITAE